MTIIDKHIQTKVQTDEYKLRELSNTR